MSGLRTASITVLPLILLFQAGCGKPDLSQEKLSRLKLGMTLAEVEQLVGGKARESRESDERIANERAARFGRPAVARKKQGAIKYVFRNREVFLFVDVDDTTGKVVSFHRWASSSGRNMPKRPGY